jgi:hypothetical protein
MSVSHLPVAGDFWLFFEKQGFNQQKIMGSVDEYLKTI